MKLRLKHGGGSTEDGRSSERAQGLTGLAALETDSGLHEKADCLKADALKSSVSGLVDFLFSFCAC